METRFVIFIVMASILTMVVYNSSTNFVSAASECFGTSSQGYVICSHTGTLSNGEAYSFLVECSQDKNGVWNCQKLGAKVMPPGIEDSIKKSMTEGLAKSTK